jgi:hypothetical protein
MRLHPFIVVASIAALLSLDVGVARASDTPGPSERLASAELPGTPEALARVAGLTKPVERARLVSEIVRALYGAYSPLPTYQDQTRIYLTTLENARIAWRSASTNGGLSLPASTAVPTTSLTNALAALGWRLKKDGARWHLVDGPEPAARQRALQLSGVDVASLARRLEAGESVAWPVSSFTVPLPLGYATWRSLLGSTARDDAGIVPALIVERRAALLYYGLMECGPGMTDLAGRSPNLLQTLGRRASTFAAFGSSFAVAAGRVATPGGPPYADVWDAFLKRPSSSPAAVFDLLLEHDAGRLAWFYETIHRLEPATLAFVMGGREAPLERRIVALTTLYQVFEQVVRGFEQPSDLSPLVRPALDPSLLLLSLRASAAGQLAPPSAHRFWEAVFETEETGGTVRLEPGGDVDAAYLITKVFAPVRQHRYDRFDALAFAQRVFATAGEAELPDAAIALRGFGRYRALLLTLERLGVRDPKPYARAVRSAARLGEVRHEHRAPALFSQFQGALALLERLRIVRRVSEADAQRLAGSLIDLEIASDEAYRGAIARWIDGELLAALRLPPITDDGPILEALAGVVPGDAAARESSAPAVVWLDWSYRLDLGGVSLRRLLQIREKQGGNRLSSALALARVGQALLDHSLTLSRLKELATTLEATVAGLQEGVAVGRPAERPWSVRATTSWARAELRGIDRPDRLSRARDVGETLIALSDVVLGDVLRALAYAPYLGDPAGPLLLGGDVSHRHDFGITIKDADTRLHAAWSLPESPTGYGLTWQVWGALLGLDVGLASLAVPQVSVGTPDKARAISEQSRKGVLQGLALFNPYDLDGGEMDRIAGAIRRGRERAAGFGRDVDEAARLALDAGVSPGRVRALLWSLEHAPDDTRSFFSMPELLRLGGGIDPGWSLQWGAPMVTWNGALLQGWNPAVRAQAEQASQPDAPQLAAGFPDLYLRLAEVLSELKLPARIAGPLARVIVASFLDEVAAAREDDAIAWSTYAASYPRSKIEGAVSALTSEGVLKPSVQP